MNFTTKNIFLLLGGGFLVELPILPIEKGFVTVKGLLFLSEGEHLRKSSD